MLRAARGATTVEHDLPELIQEAMEALLSEMVGKNSIRQEDVLSIFLTLTPDLHSTSPARILRETLNWPLVPMMSAVEPDIEGLPERCIRILIQFESNLSQAEVQMVYQQEARRLRPDLQGSP